MLPYVEFTTIQIGPLTLYVWGLFVALGFALAALVAGKFAEKRYGLDAKHVYDLTGWSIVAGIVGGRMGHVFLYEPAYYWANPWEVLYIWEGGLSLFGGLFAGVLLGVWYLKKHHLDVWKYSDAVFFGLPFGLWVGRIGCFLIHDHPGTATEFFMGIEYPDGIVRHDHGLYLSINSLLMAIVFLVLAKKQRPTGFYIALFSVWYGAVRFFLDFYRLYDVKYLMLTPAQYGSLALIVFGGWLFWRLRNNE